MYKQLNTKDTIEGVMLYLYSQNKWINSEFITRIGYNPKKSILDGLIRKINTTDAGKFGNAPNYFELTDKAKSLDIIDVTDKEIIRFLDKANNLLSHSSFNHYYHNYSKIKLVDNIEQDFDKETKGIESLKCWGKREHMYNTFHIAHDDSFSGRHHNFFTYNDKKFRKYMFRRTYEIDIAYCQPILLADHLYKTFGSNSFSDFMSREYSDIYEYLGDTREQGKSEFMSIFGLTFPHKFKSIFPDSYEILQDIKHGNPESLLRWSEGRFLRTDKRLTLEGEQLQKAFKIGELHYKAIVLMMQIKEVEMMNKVWRNLKSNGVIFIPVHDSVYIDVGFLSKTERIFEETIKEEIDKKFNIKQKTTYIY